MRSLSVAEWLTEGGDQRILCDATESVNTYGCTPAPAPHVLAYGSATASTISTKAFSAASTLYARLKGELSPPIYAREMARIRRAILQLCGLTETSGPDIIFAASGTDAHLIAAQLIQPSLVIMIEASETGSFVPTALCGRHFSPRTALGKTVTPDTPIKGIAATNIAAISSRMEDGTMHSIAQIDAEVERLAANAVAEGRPVLLVIADVSKSGMLAPSPACALKLQRQFPSMIEVLVDACQFRLAPATLCSYLAQGFALAITGSKFITGPAFSAALFLPQRIALRLRTQPLLPSLAAYSTRGDWPLHWDSSALPDVANFGLLLRWEAALAEWRAFHALPEAAITAFVTRFATAIQARLTGDPFVLLPTTALDRAPFARVQNWDHFPTIFPFLLRHRDGTWVNRAHMQQLYKQLRRDGTQLGQPVVCGTRDGIPISALRLCLSARLIVDAVSAQGRGADAVMAEALGVLDHIAAMF